MLLGSDKSGSHSSLVTFLEALRHFQGASYLEQHMSHIKPTITRRGLGSLANLLFGPPTMKQSLHQERDLIFALALCMFRNEEPMHIQVLQTIYKKLTGTKLDCPRYGNHWELIGFQGQHATLSDSLRRLMPTHFSCNPTCQQAHLAGCRCHWVFLVYLSVYSGLFRNGCLTLFHTSPL